jgi:flagellar basal-body rod protein FlgG
MAGTGMLLNRRMMEVITNNITNADTSGYKKDFLVSHVFDDVLIRRKNDTIAVGGTRPEPTDVFPQGDIFYNAPTYFALNRRVGPMDWGTQVDQKYTDYTQGSFEETGRTTDIAIAGDAFYVMETAGGERYTRAGAFIVSREGYIVDGDGNYLLGENGRILTGSDDFTVNMLGDVYANGEYIDTLRRVSFEDNNVLRKQGDNLYYTAEGEEPLDEAYRHEITQGFLENSNVDIGREMVDMITVYRTYETNQKILTMTDETVGKAVNEIGRLR